MDSFERAREYVASFHVYAGNPFLSQGEAELKDLALLRDAVDGAIAIHVRELVTSRGYRGRLLPGLSSRARPRCGTATGENLVPAASEDQDQAVQREPRWSRA